MVLNRALALKRSAVALTPVAGALAFPLIVPVVLMRFGLPAAMLSAVLIGTGFVSYTQLTLPTKREV